MLGRWPGHPGALALLAMASTVIGERGADPAWPWPRPRLSYANAAIAEAVIVAGAKLGRDHLCTTACACLAGCWPATRNGRLSVVPAGGWGRGEDRPAFDQHPIEVAALADACARAAAVTGVSTWLTGVEMSVTWPLGDNDARIPMLDERTGGCSDALGRTSRSRNQRRGVDARDDLRATAGLPPERCSDSLTRLGPTPLPSAAGLADGEQVLRLHTRGVCQAVAWC